MTDINEISEGLYLEEYIKNQQKVLEDKVKNEGLLLSYKAMWNTPDGRRVLWDILSMCRVFHLSMTGNSWTYFNEGGRQIGLYLMTMLNLGNVADDVTDFQKLKPED